MSHSNTKFFRKEMLQKWFRALTTWDPSVYFNGAEENCGRECHRTSPLLRCFHSFIAMKIILNIFPWVNRLLVRVGRMHPRRTPRVCHNYIMSHQCRKSKLLHAPAHFAEMMRAESAHQQIGANRAQIRTRARLDHYLNCSAQYTLFWDSYF